MSGAPIATFTAKDRGGFTDVAFDEAGNIWAVESSTLWRFTPSGSSFTASEYAPFGAPD